MPRYGDLDKLAVKWTLASPTQKQNFREIIEKHPTADVVPKSEVEELIKEIDSMIELVSAMTGLDVIAFGRYAELKKKYTEDNNNEHQN